MKKKVFVLFICLFLVMQFASAINTDIKINTLPNHTLNINFLNPESEGIGDLMFNTTNIKSDENGEAEVAFAHDAEVFDLSVFVMEENTKVIYKTFEGLKAGEDFTLILFPGASMIEFASEQDNVVNISGEPELNDTSNVSDDTVNVSSDLISGEVVEAVNESEIVVEEIKDSGVKGFFKRLVGFAGFAVSDEQGGSPYSKFIFYFLGVFLVGCAVLFVFNKIRHSGSSEKKEENPKPENDGEGKDEEGDEDNEEGYAIDAQRKMAEAEKEMKIANDEKRLREAKSRLQQDKDDLRRMKD